LRRKAGRAGDIEKIVSRIEDAPGCRRNEGYVPVLSNKIFL
jgi:hypothetical protein